MIGQLPRLFDKNFAIGYFLPVVVFAAVSFGLITGFDLSSSLLPILTASDLLVGTTIGLLACWLVAVMLLATNRSLYMLLEGYGRYNPARLLAWRERRRYRKLLDQKNDLAKAYWDPANQNKQEEIQAQLDTLNRNLAEQFPDSERFVLPTRVGNAIRAFEVYSRFVYGFEAIEGWNRLLAVIPKDHRMLIDDAKAQTDFWLNLWFISLLSLGEYIGFAIYAGPKIYWFPLAALFVAFVAAWGARVTAVEWGDTVKASFDTFLPELGAKLGFPTTATSAEEKELWHLFNNVIIRRSEKALHLLNAKLDQLSEKSQDKSADPDQSKSSDS